MLDHFHILAPVYDRLMGTPDAARLAALLKLPSAGWLLTAAEGPAGHPIRCGPGSAEWW